MTNLATVHNLFGYIDESLDPNGTPLTCLQGCTADHPEQISVDESDDNEYKTCRVARELAAVSDSDPIRPASIKPRIIAEIVGGLRSAGVELDVTLGAGRSLTFNPDDLRRLAAELARAADEAEALARSATTSRG